MLLFLLACANADDSATDSGKSTEDGPITLTDGTYELVDIAANAESCGFEDAYGQGWAAALLSFGVDVRKSGKGYTLTWNTYTADGSFSGNHGSFTGDGSAEVGGCALGYTLGADLTLTSKTSFDATLSLGITSASSGCGDQPVPCELQIDASFQKD